MSDTTSELGLPYMTESQSQKEATYNEMLNRLEIVIQPTAISILNDPPVSPAEGDKYIIGTTPTGAWVGRSAHLVGFIGGAWVFVAPKEGWSCWLKSSNQLRRYLSGAWAV